MDWMLIGYDGLSFKSSQIELDSNCFYWILFIELESDNFTSNSDYSVILSYHSWHLSMMLFPMRFYVQGNNEKLQCCRPAFLSPFKYLCALPK